MSQYVIVRDQDYLEHFGIKGQKWGVRRFENEDGTLTPAGKERYYAVKGVSEDRYNGNKKLERRYKQEIRKLNRLGNYADIDKQAENAKKYGKIAKGAAIGTAAAGLGLTFFANGGAKNIGREKANRIVEEYDRDALDVKRKYWKDVQELPDLEIKDWGVEQKANRLEAEGRKIGNMIRSTAANIDSHGVNLSFAIGAVGAGIAGYSAVQAYLAKKRTTALGHDAAVKKYKKQVDYMMNMFGETKYKDYLKAEVYAYKKLHPGSKMSDSEIEEMMST